MGKTKRKPGRPSVYKPEEHPKAAREIIRNGHGLREVAEVLGIGDTTVIRWQNEHPEFRAQIALGYEDRTRDVEAALLHRAKGYSHRAEKIVVVSDGQGMGSHVERVKITEHYPPDTEAAKYWLKNRAPKEWRDKSEVEVSGDLAAELAAARERLSRAAPPADPAP